MKKEQIELLLNTIGMEAADALLYVEEISEFDLISEEIASIKLSGDDNE